MREKEFSNSDVILVEQLNESIRAVKREISKVIIGQNDIIDRLLVGLLSNGHCLLIGVPGLAKTLLVKTLASALDLSFKRIQFTPDLMPGDITGTEIVEEDQVSKKRSFRFIKGPVFANIILADEINRTPPKTQSALLEAMQEHSVTAAGVTHKLQDPFFVLATQNPIEQEGTYPLPEAQLDRFMFSLTVLYPSFSEEVEIIKSTTSDFSSEIIPVLTPENLLKYQSLIKRVPVANNVIEYAVRIVNKTRPNEPESFDYINNLVSWGAGPRASQFLIMAAKTKAVMEGRFTPDIDDVKQFLIPVLKHRVIPNFNAQADNITPLDIITKLINSF